MNYYIAPEMNSKCPWGITMHNLGTTDLCYPTFKLSKYLKYRKLKKEK